MNTLPLLFLLRPRHFVSLTGLDTPIGCMSNCLARATGGTLSVPKNTQLGWLLC